MSRHRSGSKKAPPEIGLHMECTEEDLEPCQIVHYNKAETEYNEIQNKLDNYISKMKAEVIEKGENCLVLQLNVSTANTIGTTQVPPVTSSGKVTRQSVQAAQNYQQVVGQGIITRSSSNTAGNTYLVMDPRLGLVVGQVPPTAVTTENTTATPAKTASGSRTRPTPGTVMVTTRARSGGKKPAATSSEPEVLTSTSTRTRDKFKTQAQTPQPASPPSSQIIQQVYSPSTTTTNTPGSYRVKVNAKILPPPAKPAENNALGGLTAGSKTPWKPSPDDGTKGNAPDSKEVAFNKMSRKTFPSLVVAARPHLRLKYIPQSTITQERTALDAKVKGVLMYTPSTFTEWLIQEGLIKSEQTCQFHVNNDLSPVKLNLGMYSDVSKFPYSGGYVWISDCCPSQFVSVFSGSIFEGAPHPPTTLLKLIYHWACQTNFQNVVQWVKVDNLYVKNFFTNMRAVCTQAIHQKHQKLGGPRSKIEVGVISLGTTSQDGNMRQVKVEVLGVMDPENKLIRLRALEPISEEKNFKRRFAKILEPLEDWVHKESTIFTDFTVDKGTLINMGFRTVYQISASDPPTKYSNQNVMEYLRRIVPRMFQNTLSLLSRQIIQQFLDELVWREMWGPIPSQAFDSIIAHIAEQTKLDVSDSLLFRLNKVASNPFKTWNYSVWKPVTVNLSNTKAQQPVADLDSVPLFTRLASLEGVESAASIIKSSRSRKRVAEPSTLDAIATSTPLKKPTKMVGKDKLKKEEKGKFLEKSFKREVPEKPITDEIVAFINGKTGQIPMDSYYYGTRQGDEELIASEYKGAFVARCSVCNKRFDDNISVMKHMILHTQVEPALTVSLKSVQQCSSCFSGFDTSIELKEHMDEAHAALQSKTGTVCQICEESFANRIELVYHMHRTHVEMELPYECGVCLFRTSLYKVFIDHFVQIHKGGEHVLCPFCLKVVAFAYKGKPMPDNIRFYESHLEKHYRTALTKKCHRCKLSFIHKGIFDQHLEADHVSFKMEPGVTPFADGPAAIMMPEPGNLIKTMTPPKSLKIYRARPMFVANKFKSLEINGVDDNMACIECEGCISKLDHFTCSFNCLKCRYATCCERAMAEHTTIFHETTPPQFSLGKPIVLPEAMHCVCGFSNYSGNRLAKHIAVCEKKSAYPSEEAADAALVLKDKSPSKSQQSGEGHSMLNMLGLVRKSPEIGGSNGDMVNKESKSENMEDGSLKPEEGERNDAAEQGKEESESLSKVDSSMDATENVDETPKESSETPEDVDMPSVSEDQPTEINETEKEEEEEEVKNVCVEEISSDSKVERSETSDKVSESVEISEDADQGVASTEKNDCLEEGGGPTEVNVPSESTEETCEKMEVDEVELDGEKRESAPDGGDAEEVEDVLMSGVEKVEVEEPSSAPEAEGEKDETPKMEEEEKSSEKPEETDPKSEGSEIKSEGVTGAGNTTSEGDCPVGLAAESDATEPKEEECPKTGVAAAEE